MEYYLIQATTKDKSIILKYKLKTIVNNSMDKDTIIKIKKYIINNLKEHLKDYKVIVHDNIIIEIVCYYLLEDYCLLDEIYLIKEYRNKGICTSIIKEILEKSNKDVCLYVYKDTTKAITLYKKLGFCISLEEKERYKMKHIK